MQLDKKACAGSPTMPDVASLFAWPVMAERTIALEGCRTRISLETMVWDGLDEVARREGRPVAELCGELNAGRGDGIPLATAIRTFVLHYFREAMMR